MLDYIKKTPRIRDVILSGGDPLTFSTGRLERIISALRRIKHVEIIRIGTRYPVTLPQRITVELCSMLAKYGPIWVNTHFNHPAELTPEAAQACHRLLRAGMPVNNQCVLLRGVNDTVKVQEALCRGLLKINVRPYYLFHTDDVQATEHLRTPVEAGIAIMAGLRGSVSGLGLPTYVVDLPGGGGKVPLQPDYLDFRLRQRICLPQPQGQNLPLPQPCRLRNGGGWLSNSWHFSTPSFYFCSLFDNVHKMCTILISEQI